MSFRQSHNPAVAARGTKHDNHKDSHDDHHSSSLASSRATAPVDALSGLLSGLRLHAPAIRSSSTPSLAALSFTSARDKDSWAANVYDIAVKRKVAELPEGWNILERSDTTHGEEEDSSIQGRKSQYHSNGVYVGRNVNKQTMKMRKPYDIPNVTSRKPFLYRKGRELMFATFDPDRGVTRGKRGFYAPMMHWARAGRTKGQAFLRWEEIDGDTLADLAKEEREKPVFLIANPNKHDGTPLKLSDLKLEWTFPIGVTKPEDATLKMIMRLYFLKHLLKKINDSEPYWSSTYTRSNLERDINELQNPLLGEDAAEVLRHVGDVPALPTENDIKDGDDTDLLATYGMHDDPHKLLATLEAETSYTTPVKQGASEADPPDGHVKLQELTDVVHEQEFYATMLEKLIASGEHSSDNESNEEHKEQDEEQHGDMQRMADDALAELKP